MLLPIKATSTPINHTALHLASKNGHHDIVKMLLAAGCNVNITTPNGSALHEAALCGKEKVVKILLNEGINLDLTDCDGRTVFDVLDDFPAHVVQRIRNIINHYYQRSSLYDSESDDHHNIVVDRRSRKDHIAIEYQTNNSRNSYQDKQLNHQNRNNLYSDQNEIYGETSSPSSMGSFGAASSGFSVHSSKHKNSSNPNAPSKPPRKSLSISPPHHSKHKNIMTKSFEFDLDQELFDADRSSSQSKKSLEKPKKNGDNPKKAPYEYLFLSQTQENNHQNKRNSLRTSDDEPKSDFEYTIMSGPLTIPRNFKNDDNKIVRVMNPHRKLKKGLNNGNLKTDSE